jgi:hypothetical protein
LPTVTPQVVQKTTLVPETQVVQKPVTVTRYVDEVTTRKVPVETYRTEKRVTTRKVPVEVRRPVTKQVVRKVPVEQIEYESQEVVRQVPVVTQRFERVEKVEPYQVQVCRWEPVETERQTPTVVTRRVPVETVRMVPRTVMMNVPVDMFGNPVPGMAAIPVPYVSSPVTQLPPVYESYPVADSVVSPQRIYTARPDTLIREPASQSVPETPVKAETELVPTESKPDSGAATPAADDKSGQPSTGDGDARPAAADQKPSLELPGGDTSKAGESGSDSALPALEGPARPGVEESTNRPRQPIDT